MEQIRILTVCTGNICRSPFAERVLAARLRAAGLHHSQVVVRSAGTQAMVGDPMTEPTRALVVEHGGEPASFASRQLVAGMVQEADLVLALTREHRKAVARLHPRATRYTFTLRELARLLALAAPDLSAGDGDLRARLQALTVAAAAKRGFQALASPDEDDVVDPYRGTAKLYGTSAAQMLPAIDAVAQALASGRRVPAQ